MEDHGHGQQEDALDGFPVEGFLRFFREQRTELIRQSGLHLLAPNRARLSSAAAAAWKKLGLDRQHQYQKEALEVHASSFDGLEGIACDSADDGQTMAGRPASPPRHETAEVPTAASLVGQDKEGAPTKKRGRPPGPSKPRKSDTKAGSAAAPLVASVEEKADSSESKKKPRARASSSSYSLSSAKSASTAEQQLESLSVSVLRAKVRYLGAEPSIIARCIEKRELVSLALELLRNSSLNSRKKSKNPRKK